MVVNRLGEKWITSVGIDLGTSTTKLIVSHLQIALISPAFALPQYQIVERRLIYSSPIYRTPLLNTDVIDMEEVSKILEFEYQQARIQFSTIKSGAIIITGETATKQNANQIVHHLAERAGDFVVATAGADLEGILAGKGSGAHARSTQTDGIIANVDIGGGTANIVLFEHGKVVDTVTFHVGGRLLELHNNGVIKRISPHLSQWLKNKGHAITEGDCVTFPQLTDICCGLIRSILSYLAGWQKADLLVGNPLQRMYAIQEVMISGGIGLLMGKVAPGTIQDVTKYGDIGPLLAAAIEVIHREYPFPIFQATQTQHATVIGAGMQTTEISGGTVFANASLLPLRNVPVLQVTLRGDSTPEIKREIEHAMNEGKKWFHEQDEKCLAFALSGIEHISYQTLSRLAEEFSFHFSNKFSTAQAMIVICEIDMAKALGQAIALRCRDGPPVICIDQVFVEHGDYIDLGVPMEGEMIPVIIKTLVFPKQADEVKK